MIKANSKKSAAAPKSKQAALNPETKKERVLALLRSDGGATLEQVVDATGWLPHTARAVFTGLRKKGFAVERSRTEGVTRYAITAEPAA